MNNLPEKQPQTTHWVQTERATHEAWAALTREAPKAAVLLHLLVARVGENNAVVVSQGALAKLMGCHRNTVITAIRTLKDRNWIEVRQIGDRGSVNAYVLNDRVAWASKRDGLRYSLFSASVIVSEDEQPDREFLENQEPLRSLPIIDPGEGQLPDGEGLPPPSEPTLPGMEPDLPTIQRQPTKD